MSLTSAPVIATGGDSVEDIDGYRIHKFTTTGSSSFVVTRGGPVEVLVVAGGGGGGQAFASSPGGGGGAGELIYNSSFNVSGAVSVIVGTGGSGGTSGPGGDGGNSSFGTLVGIGGGGGGSSSTSMNRDGRNGGSGGGASRGLNTYGVGGSSTKTIGLGSNGGSWIFGISNSGSGGGGAMSAGLNAFSDASRTPGGNGYTSGISGANVVYASGGYGGMRNNNVNGDTALPNTGSGGGGGDGNNTTTAVGGTGGSGIVIVRYPIGTFTRGPQPQIFLGPLMSYPAATGTPPSNDGTKLTFARASLQFLNFGSQTFDMTKGFSATCRFAFTGTAVAYERIFDFGKGQGNDNLILCRNYTTQRISFYFQNGATQYFMSSTNSVAQGQVNTVTAIYTHSPVSLTIILNGVTTTAIPAAAATTPRTLNLCYVGKSNWTDDPYPNIDIYSLNIYNRVLTPNELVGPPAPSPWGIFTSTPNGLTSDQAAVSGRALRQGYPGYQSGTYWLKPTSGSVAGLAFVDMTTDGGGWTLAYETVNATRDGTGAIVYSVNNSSNLSALTFTRVAYSMNNFNSWAFTSFDSWSATLSAHRIPSNVDAFVNQRRVNNLNVVSSNTNVTTGTGLAGALEIWPYDYIRNINTSIGTYGSGSIYDINDTVSIVTNGHGSFQVHDITNLRPVICWNRHRYGDTPEIGFGPRFDGSDWTIVSGIGPTSDFRVRVFVR